MKYFCAALGVLFIGLKLTGHIDWSWWWVLAPVYGPICLTVFFGALAVLFAFLHRKLETPEERLSRQFKELANKLGRR